MRLLILSILSIVLMVMDYREHYVAPVKKIISEVVAPLQYAVSVPIKWVESINNNFSSRESLAAENASLRAQQLLLQAQLQKTMALESENTQLRALLATTPRAQNDRITVAQLLAVNTDPLTSEVILNKGKQSHLYVGQPVLDATGIMGQVVEVGVLTSRVLLLADPRSAIPIQDARNGVRGIVAGQGNLEKLSLTDVPITVDIKEGDMLVSSGLGGHYPEGYPVGMVSRVRSDPNEQFAAIDVTPSAQLDRNQPVLLIWPHSTPIDVQISNHSKQKNE